MSADEVRAAHAHVSRWRRNVGELVGVQAEGTPDGELHRLLKHYAVSPATLSAAVDALGGDYPPFATADEAVREFTSRATGDGAVDCEIVDEDSVDYRSGYSDALRRIALLIGHSRDYAAAMKPHEIGESLRGLRLRADRCSSCPWPSGTACGGAETVCEGNVIPPVGDALDLPTDKEQDGS